MHTTKKSRYTIGVMLGDTQSDYSEELLSGFYTCANEENVNLIFLMGPQTPQYCSDILSCNNNGHYQYQFDTIYDYAHFSNVDALIIAYGSLSMSTRNNDLSKFLKDYSHIPCLLLEDIPEHVNAPFLIADNYNGIHVCMEHLILDHHYKKIAFVCGPKSNRDSNERLSAYKDAMKENKLPYTEDMIVYGNYSESADPEVEYLLAHNPGLEAIVFANDNMAKAGYRVCNKHNLIVGQDIAITGFDNVDFAQTMTPPLTSVSHSSFQFSYTALKNALLLCQGKEPVSKRMPTIFHKRCSCGCAPMNQLTYEKFDPAEFQAYVRTSASNIASEILSSIPYENNKLYYTHLIRDFFDYVYDHTFVEKDLDYHSDYISALLHNLLDYNHISSTLVLEQFSNILRIMIANSSDIKTQKILSGLISYLHQYTHTKDITNLEQQIVDFNRKSWFVPTLTRDLINGDISFKDSILSIMHRLQMMNIQSSYLYLFDRPIPFEAQRQISFSENLRLTAYYTKNESVFLDVNDRPILGTQSGFSNYLLTNKNQILTTFILFSGDEQFGTLLCEVAQKDIAFLQICSLQLGSLLRFIQLNHQEKVIQKELHDSLKVIQEKNDILSFISEYDELSKLLNRRGFMERSLRACRSNKGKQAYLIFGDLDHLKEINDCFGHASGDFAIRTAADILVSNLPGDALIARIGGDEFIAFVLDDSPSFKERFFNQLTSYEKEINDNSNQPFYVELSVGILGFICHPRMDLHEAIQQADEILYQSKAHRRLSIRK